MAVTTQPPGMPVASSSGSMELTQHHGKEHRRFKELDILEEISFLQIQQEIASDLKESCGGGNTYIIKNSQGDVLLHAEEERNCCGRWFCGPQRDFIITIYNTEGNAVLYLERPGCRCDWFCCVDCCCCQNSLQIKDKEGRLLGSVCQRFHIFNLKADIMNEEEEVIHHLRGPFCSCRCSTQISIDIVDGDRDTGYISKQWPGRSKWVNMDHELIHVQYPNNISVQEKAILLGGAFLVAFMYFEMS